MLPCTSIWKIDLQSLIDLNWNIGKLIVERQEAYGWGKSVVEQLSKELRFEFSNASEYSAGNLWRMHHFYLSYRKKENLVPLVREIGWSPNILIFENAKLTSSWNFTSE